MGNFFGPTDNLLIKAMDYAQRRSKALTANIANSNTPGYKRIDVSFPDLLERGGRIPLARTNGRHLAGSREQEPQVVTDKTSSMRNDGNNVDLEREMAELTQTSMFFDGVAEIYTRRLAALRSVVQDGRR